MTDLWSNLPHLWLSIGLPGFEKRSTYQGYPLDFMPEIPIDLDEDLSWLLKNGQAHPGQGLDQWDMYAMPKPAALAIELAARQNIVLPASFRQFMTSPNLQSHVRSCTDCYLDPGERMVETIGSLAGYLIHFLSDSQSCAHWYLHVLRSGESSVLETDDLYCYEITNSDWIENPACRQERINIEELDFRFCSASFPEFLFRFWIENEIWYALHGMRRPLTELEQAYLGTNSAPAS
ncbi:MAG TPA: hypothetical protein VGI45_10355 [Terracidiphilus sp.]|jgi:hypothetical protein